jgi:hypothetical protein
MDQDHTSAIYKEMLSDILNGQNLDKHLKDVEAAINDLNEKIRLSDNSEGFKKLKNELYYLKLQILERN